MTNREVITLLNNLHRFDGEFTGPNQPTVPYNLSTAALYAISKNISRAEVIEREMDKLQKKLLKTILAPEEKQLPKDDPRFPGYVEELGKIYDQEAEFTPYKFRFSDLRPEANKYPPTLIAKIDALFLDETPTDSSAGAPSGVQPPK
jgi:uncharacterized protein Yka (UPF0111/DUF47 family)